MSEEKYVEFIEENKKLLGENQKLQSKLEQLETELRIAQAEIALYKKLSSKIVALVNSRETFNSF